ncbi:MAG: phosphoribosyltransferase family protein [Candidatus Paceibacterota bacterium]
MYNKILKLFESLFSLILPKEELAVFIENMSEEDIFKEIPQANDTSDKNFKALFQYKNKICRKAIWEIKYCSNKKITQRFSNLLYEFILNEISDEISFSNFNNPLLIPVPISKNNLKERGFNQCELMVKEIQKIDVDNFFEFSFNSVFKTKDTLHQSKLKNRTKRLKNLNGCFSVNGNTIKGRNIIIVDDVITTGATMSEISKTLKDAGVKKVIGFALGH